MVQSNDSTVDVGAGYLFSHFIPVDVYAAGAIAIDGVTIESPTFNKSSQVTVFYAYQWTIDGIKNQGGFGCRQQCHK